MSGVNQPSRPIAQAPGLSPGLLAQIACVWEVTARKPGNVHRGCDFADGHYLDFLLSASAIAGPMDRAASIGVGTAILEAVEATRRVVTTNTNLGMILLLAPLAAVSGADHASGVARVLAETTVEDARHVFRAIRLARPGGLGSVAEQDVGSEPTVTLVEAMRLAADRDLVARQYANDYTEVFRIALPALREALELGQPLETAIITTHLTLLAGHPDSLIARKRGPGEAAEASRRAAEVLAAGWPDSPGARTAIDGLDQWLRAVGNSRNPGTTADLVTAALFAGLRDGTIQLPRPSKSWESPAVPGSRDPSPPH
jgi:triphosphoribosyl-dephospho-CoA synthase